MARCSFHRALLICLLLPGAVHAQVLPFTHYTPDSDRAPLPSADVQQVYQDRLGYIWMVVYSSGLARYDGVTLDLYTTDDGLKDLNLRDVLEDSLGRLWVASEAGLVVSEKPLADYANGSRIRFTALIGQTPLLDVATYKNRIAADEQGWLWVGTDGDGIIRYRVDNLQQTTTDTIRTALYDERQNLTVRSIAVRRSGSIWVGLSGGRLLVFDDDAQHFEVFSRNEEPAFDYTAVLYESPSGILWGGENNGHLWRLEEADGKQSIITVSTELASGLASIMSSGDRMLWAASAGSGLLRINLQEESDRIVYTRKNGLLSETLRHVMQDREGNIWVGQSSGVSKLRFDYTAFESITATSYAGETPILPAPGVNAVVLTPQRTDVCRLWVGTSEGLVCIGENGESEYVQDVQGLRDNWVYALTLDQAGRLWLGTDAGINGLALHTPVPFPPAPESRTFTFLGGTARVAGYRGTTIVAATHVPMPRDEGDPATIESLWFPGYKSLYCLVNNTWFVFRASSGLSPTWYHTVAYDSEGRLWVGTRDHGLYRSTTPLTLAALRNMERVDVPFVLGHRRGLFGSEVTAPVFEQVWSISNGAPTNQIESLIWRDGVLWVGTPEGLITLEGTPPRMTAHLTRQKGLKANNAMTMAFSPATGSLWVATNGGLAEVDPTSREVIRTVTRQDGLLDNEVWWYGSLAIGDDGTVYFGTAKGLALYRPHEDKVNDVEPLLHVKAVSYSEDGTGSNELAMEYAALSYADEKQVRYKTRLVEYDADWSSENADVKIRYTNLPALFTSKTYHLEVLACNDDGLWTKEPLTYTFHVQPAWWLRWWAFIVYAALLVTGVVVVDRIHTAQLIAKERRKAEMEQARLRAEAAELKSRALQAENERNQIELEKAAELEVAYQAIQRQAEEIRHKNEENERLLLNILPEPIATRLKQGEEPIADTFAEVTILFADLVGFTPLSSRLPAPELVDLLNDLFSVFDQLAFEYGVEKIKTIGDSYMAVSGLPEQRVDHAEVMIEMVIAMLESIEQFNIRHGTQLQLRIGLNTGPVVAGVIGRHKFIYDLWGDAVNTASRMESHGVPGRVHVTREVYEKVKEHFAFESRGEIEVKGKGRMETYLLKPRKERAQTAAVS